MHHVVRGAVFKALLLEAFATVVVLGQNLLLYQVGIRIAFACGVVPDLGSRFSSRNRALLVGKGRVLDSLGHRAEVGVLSEV